jgi:hypothetical protein
MILATGIIYVLGGIRRVQWDNTRCRAPTEVITLGESGAISLGGSRDISVREGVLSCAWWHWLVHRDVHLT